MKGMAEAGIVLCGGKSTRMGSSKALLPFGSETMLQRVVRLLGEVVSPMVVVAAVDQDLPALPRDVIIARDEREARGPLEGLRAGLKALPADVERRTSRAATCRCSYPTSSVRCSILPAATTWRSWRSTGSRIRCPRCTGVRRCRLSTISSHRIGCGRCSCSRP